MDLRLLEAAMARRDAEQMESFDWRKENPPTFQRIHADKVCPACGESFYDPHNQGTQVYCSRECWRARKVKGQLTLVFVQDAVAPPLKTANKMREHG